MTVVKFSQLQFAWLVTKIRGVTVVALRVQEVLFIVSSTFRYVKMDKTYWTYSMIKNIAKCSIA